MSIYEAKEVLDCKLPNDNYQVSYHTNRGYDSPDRWFEARYNNVLLGEFAYKEEAIKACFDFQAQKPCKKIRSLSQMCELLTEAIDEAICDNLDAARSIALMWPTNWREQVKKLIKEDNE